MINPPMVRCQRKPEPSVLVPMRTGNRNGGDMSEMRFRVRSFQYLVRKAPSFSASFTLHIDCGIDDADKRIRGKAADEVQLEQVEVRNADKRYRR